MDILKALTKVIGPPQEYHGKEIYFFCPFHQHHKPKLSIDVDSHRWHCWVCDRGGHNLRRLLRFRGETSEYSQYIQAFGGEFAGKDSVKKSFETPKLPKEYRTLTKDWKSPYCNHALDYLADRDVSVDDIWYYKIGYCEDGEYKNRIIFPSFDSKGNLNFVLGRSFYENTKPYHHGVFDKDIVFNEYLIDWRQPVILVEGIFDSIVAGKNSIPRLGSTLTEKSYLFSKMLKAPKVYLSFDTDAYDKQLEIAGLFLAYGKCPYIVDLGEAKDPGSMTKAGFIAALSLAEQVKSEYNLLKLKVKR